MRIGLITTVFLLASCSSKPPARQTEATPPDLLAWAPPETYAAVTVRNLNVLAEVFDDLKQRLADVPLVTQAITRLRGVQLEGHKVFRGQWGPGLALDRGLALFVGKDTARSNNTGQGICS